MAPLNVTATIRRIVREKGSGYIYQKPSPYAGAVCQYLTYEGNAFDGEAHNVIGPSCLVGQVAWALGFKESWDFNEGNPVYDQGFAHGMTERQIRALSAAQLLQDSGYSWGDALEAYEQAFDDSAFDANAWLKELENPTILADGADDVVPNL